MSNQTLILNKLNNLQKLKSSKSYWNITQEQGIFLSNLIDIKKPKRVLEIGTSNGYSTLWIAKNLDEKATIDTIEIDETRFDEAKNNFESCNLTNITQHFGHILEIIPKLTGKYDLIFMDAGHSLYLEILKQLEQQGLFSKDFTFLVDNVTSHNNMSEFLNYVKKNYYFEIIEIGGGFLFVKHK